MNIQFLKLVCLGGLLLMNSLSHAQSRTRSGGNVDYKVLIDDPDHLIPVIIGINPLVADVWSTNTYMGIGAFVGVNISKYGSVNVEWTKAYFDGVKGGLPAANSNTGLKIKNHRGLEVGFAYNLLSFKKSKDLQVVLSSELTFSGTRRTQYTSYIVVPGTAKKMVQLRGGYTSLKTAMDAYDFGFSRFLINNDTSLKVRDFYAQIKLNYLYAGISWHTINNLVLQIGEGGLASNCNDYNFFFDMLLLPGDVKFQTVNYSNVFDKNTFPGKDISSSYVTVSDLSYVRKTGWRIGWEARKNNIRGAFTYKVEMGVRPGIMNGKKGLFSATSYMLISAGFTFPKGKKYKTG